VSSRPNATIGDELKELKYLLLLLFLLTRHHYHYLREPIPRCDQRIREHNVVSSLSLSLSLPELFSVLSVKFLADVSDKERNRIGL
jgi:hypothetical protein